jgi:isochorismate synthase
MKVLAPEQRAALRRHLAATRAEAHRLAAPLLAAFHAPVSAALDPLALLAAAAPGERFAFEAPARARMLVTSGDAGSIESAGPTRFGDAARAARALFERVRIGGPPAAAPAGPVLVGGFAFADVAARRGPWSGFPALRFRLPSLAAAWVDGRAAVTLATAVAPGDDTEALASRLEASLERWVATCSRCNGDDPPPAFAARAETPRGDYLGLVARALRAIAAGELDKVVVARACTIRQAGGFDPVRIFAALRAAHGDCFAFALAAGEACFVGASPELLLRREGDRLVSSALAGSAPRGRSPQEDEALGQALQDSKKERAEHALVVRAIREALVPFATDVSAPDAPRLLRLDGIQHLHTPVSGRLRAPRAAHFLELAGALHPTPAVGGAPREAARAWLRAHERLERGWYAGGVGWLSPSGDGELAVALRGALLRGATATLHAGAGVVEGSTPEGELRETALKLRAALSALVEL